MDGASFNGTIYNWMTVAGLKLEVGFQIDALSAMMMCVVTFVSLMVHIYTIGYMAEDEGYNRFFSYISLFTFSMLMLVMANNFLQLFFGWEAVGLVSYLLIGFWYTRPTAIFANMKAFLVNRVGDFGFILGIGLLLAYAGSMNYQEVFAQKDALVAATLPGTDWMIITVACICLFIGAMGKSAQFPLHVWLPDSMEGPTPISALIHAATMVTAGVYLVARLHGIFLHAPEASALVATIGVATAFFAATIAVVQTDIKKVLAYSTISQLGFMFLAAGVGAYGVAVFHLYTHAFFKACLFLGAGSVIHAMSGEQDIRKMGGLAKKIPITFVTFAIATAAIAGLPPLAGFFSKDEILWFALASERGGAPWLLVAAAATALMTAFYMFRLLWLTFFGTPRMDEKTAHHIHESPWSMAGVLVVLAVLSAIGGFFSIPHFLEGQLPLPPVKPELKSFHTVLLVLSVVIAALGLAGAAWFYARNGARAERARLQMQPLHRLLSGKYYIDELYEALIGRPIRWISDRVFLRIGDRLLLDGTLNGMASVARGAAGQLARVQTGNLHFYAFLVLAGLVALLLWSWGHV
jgi:NADH-quinone oxidoreductase subunit L